jgi:uncharacterized protein (TIGR00369 family)
MTSIETIQDLLRPLFPGYMGVEVTGITAECVTGRLIVRPELCTAGGILHGGAYMAFADTLGAVATLANLPPDTRTTTIESKTNFLGAAEVGTTVTAECTPLHRGRTTMVWQTTIRSQGGKPCAIVLQTQLVIAG